MAKSYYEFKDSKSSKFWEIEVSGGTVTVRYGKIGTDGQTSVKKFKDPGEAKKHAAKITAEKVKKGYLVASSANSKRAAVSAIATVAGGRASGRAAMPATKSSVKPHHIAWFVTISLVTENPAEECEWFGPDASDPFPASPMVDLFLDGDEGIVGVRVDDGEIILGAEAAAEHCRAQFKSGLKPLAKGGKLHAMLNSSAAIDGAKVSWDGDALELQEDDRDHFLDACWRKGAIVVWKQIRAVDWKPKAPTELEQLLERGDHDSYEDLIAVV